MFHRRWLCALLAVGALSLGACAPDPRTVAAQQEAQAAVEMEPTPEPTPSPSETPSATESPTPTPSPTPEESAEPTPTQTTPSAPPAVYSPGDSGDEIRDLQHRLRQLSWLTGEITDSYDARLQAAVDGFQSKRDLPVLGYVDQATLDVLTEMTRKPTHEEMFNLKVAGPPVFERGDSGDEIRDLQARLKQIAWFTDRVTGNYGPVTEQAVKGFQEKRELPVTGYVDQETLDVLRSMTSKPTAEELADEPAEPKESTGMTLDPRCLTGRAICVSKADRQLAWVVDGEVRLSTDVRFGSELTPTRNGAFSVGWKSRDHVSSLYDTAMPYALFFSGGQAIHYSADFAARGYNGASHGCVNVRDKAVAEALFDAVRTGDPVIVY